MNSVLIILHVLGITFWVGGILVYLLALTPSLTAIGPADRGKLVGAFVKRFGLLTWIAIILVFGTGSILTYGMASRVDNLFATSYGRTLLVKIVAAVLMVLNGAYLGLVLGGRMASFAPPPGAAGPGQGGPPPGPPPALLQLQKRMALFGWIQVGLALAVLVLNGLL